MCKDDILNLKCISEGDKECRWGIFTCAICCNKQYAIRKESVENVILSVRVSVQVLEFRDAGRVACKINKSTT